VVELAISVLRRVRATLQPLDMPLLPANQYGDGLDLHAYGASRLLVPRPSSRVRGLLDQLVSVDFDSLASHVPWRRDDGVDADTSLEDLAGFNFCYELAAAPVVLHSHNPDKFRLPAEESS